jgi:site-specific recombinase XerD
MGRKTTTYRITSPDLTALINPENMSLVEKFLKDKATRSSPATIEIYRSNLMIFFTWNLKSNENKFFVDIRKIEFSEFFSFVVDELRVGSARQNSLRSVLSSLSNFIEKFYDDKYPTFRNVILRVIESTPKEIRREKTILTDAQVDTLLRYLSETDPQKACWLALAACSGARFAELLRFDIGFIDETRTAFGDLFLETTKQIKTKGRGRGGKLLYKYIIRDKFLPYYHAWLIERARIMDEKGQKHNSLFVLQDGSPATEGAVRCWFADFEKVLGVPFYPHALRHYVVTLFSRRGIPYSLIKELIGWSNLEMCSIYDDQTARDKTWKELEGINLREKRALYRVAESHPYNYATS